jgi:nucleoside diphosphate kinase
MNQESADKIIKELDQAITELEYKIVELKTLKIEPDLSYINSFYKEKTEENINRLNSQIKTPKLSFYLWVSSFAMLIISFMVFFFTFSKLEETKENSIKEYKNQLSKNSVIMSKENAELLKDMDLWFKSDPQSTSKFIHWRQNQK